MKTFISIGVMVGVCVGCGGRDSHWDRPLTDVQPFALSDAVAVSDPAANRVVLLTTDPEQQVRRSVVSTQRGVRTVMAAPDRSKLFLISTGDGEQRPPAGQVAQTAALEIVTRGQPQTQLYPLSEALSGLALDPRGKWAVIYADKSSDSLVRNPNELLLVDLEKPPVANENPLSRTLRSFGGQPQRFTFTDLLNLPGGPRRLLIVETELDVAIVDLDRPREDEITIQLTSGQDTRQLHPAGLAVSDGSPTMTDDARIAIRLDNDPTVLIAQLVPGTGRDFRPDLNLVDVGGLASDVAFVHTDGGALALAALVPGSSKAVLIDPATSLTVDVPLPAPYRRVSLVTEQAGVTGAAAAPAVDVALLWGGANGVVGGVSFWELGRTAGQPYRSVETVGVTAGITSVTDVPGNHPELKILGTQATAFFLLNLRTRTSAPFATSQPGVALLPSRTGDRAWAYVANSKALSVIGLESLHPQTLSIDRPISQLFDIAAADGNSEGDEARSLVVWHDQGNKGVTVYDARASGVTAALDKRRNYSSLLTEDDHDPLP